MALQTKTITANGSKGHHRFTLKVNEDTTSGNSSFMSYSFTISPIQSGWDWGNWGSQISYNVKIGDNTYNGTIPSYNGSSTITLSSGSNIEIAHNTDGTKSINVSFSVSDTTGQSYTCGNASSSDTMTLTALHKSPDLTAVSITAETNSNLTSLGLATGTIVQYLSVKQFTITATPYDSATITSYRVYHRNTPIGISSSNVVSVDFSRVEELQTTLVNGTYYVTLQFAVLDNKNGFTLKEYDFPVIKYTRPTIEKTSTLIKRKTDSSTPLTSNIAVLNFVGTCYKGNDVIGNNNTQQVQYKIWNGTEPSYTNISSTQSGGNVTITNYQISNILYTKVYDYKIKIKDSFTDSDTDIYVKIGKVSTGVSVWTEYSNRVDFLSATIGGNPIVESGNGYVKYYDGTMICYGSDTTSTLSWTQDSTIWYSRGLTLPDFAEEFISAPIVFKTIQNMNTGGRNINICGNSAPTTTNPGTYNLDTYWNATGTTVTVSYIAIGKWK